MKKMFLVIVLLVIMCACGEKNKTSLEDDVLVKVDSSKSNIYLDDLEQLNLTDGTTIVQKIPVINYKTTDADNVNLEVKSRAMVNLKKAIYDDELISKIYYSEYEIFESELYDTLVEKDYLYFQNEKSIVDVHVYVLSKANYKLVDNDTLLNSFSYSLDDLFGYIRRNLQVTDPEYEVMLIKNNDYYLAVTDGYLTIYYMDTTDDNIELKKMVIS